MRRLECMDHYRKDMPACYKHLVEVLLNKKMLLEKYFNEHQEKILIYVLAAVVAIIAFTEIYDRRDEDEKLIGFGEYQDYKVEKINLPTEGDVVLLKKIPFREYETKKLTNGNVLITGNFYYEIRPQTKYAPDLQRSDIYGNTPENSNYWGDMRYGTVLLSMKDQ